MELSVEEFHWNLKRLLREGFPQGIPVEDLSAKYSYWLRKPVGPNSIIPECENWGKVFRVQALLKKSFLISVDDDKISHVKIRGTNEESNDELREVLDLVNYDNVVFMREHLCSQETVNQTTSAETSAEDNCGRENRNSEDNPNTCTEDEDRNTKLSRDIEVERKKSPLTKHSIYLNDKSPKARDPVSLDVDDVDMSSEHTTRTSKSNSQKTGSAVSSLNKKSAIFGDRRYFETEKELPLSPARTTDFTTPSPLRPVLTTKLVMLELGQFNATVHHVSHNQVDGVFFPDCPVAVVGRIAHDNVWDYISRMKKNKEFMIFRLAPASTRDLDGYMAFFCYLATRGRFGVLGGIAPPLKDAYLIPLDKSSPLNQNLVQSTFEGPGLPKERSHCLLVVVARYINQPDQPPRKIKRPKPTDPNWPSEKQKQDLLEAAKKMRRPGAPLFLPSTSVVSRAEDSPYVPLKIYGYSTIDEKGSTGDDIELGKCISAVKEKTQAELLMEELTAKIEKEKQDIESMTAAISKTESVVGTKGQRSKMTETGVESVSLASWYK